MRAEVFAAVDRILAAWPADGRFVLDLRGVDDWSVALADARWLVGDRDSDEIDYWAVQGDSDHLAVKWLRSIQEDLALAALPELDRLPEYRDRYS